MVVKVKMLQWDNCISDTIQRFCTVLIFCVPYYSVVYGIGVTLIEPKDYASFFNREKVYGYSDDFERSVYMFSNIFK